MLLIAHPMASPPIPSVTFTYLYIHTLFHAYLLRVNIILSKLLRIFSYSLNLLFGQSNSSSPLYSRWSPSYWMFKIAFFAQVVVTSNTCGWVDRNTIDTNHRKLDQLYFFSSVIFDVAFQSPLIYRKTYFLYPQFQYRSGCHPVDGLYTLNKLWFLGCQNSDRTLR